MTEDEVDIEFAHIVKPPRTVAYRIGYGFGIATLAEVPVNEVPPCSA